MITIIIGNQRTGKSCLAALKAQKYLKKGHPVFSNLPIKGCYEFTLQDIMHYDFCMANHSDRFKKNPVLVIDEGATYGLGSRGNMYKKNTTQELVEFFTMHGHYHIQEVVIVSPNFEDVIPSVRDNATDVIVVKRGLLSLFGLISYRHIIRSYDIDNLSNQLVYKYMWKPWSTWWFRRSRAYDLFDSWVGKDLETKVWHKWSDYNPDEFKKTIKYRFILLINNLKLLIKDKLQPVKLPKKMK